MHRRTIHYDKTLAVWQVRRRFIHAIYARAPERFIRGVPKVAMPPRKVWINKPVDPQAAEKVVGERSGRQSRNFVLKRDQYQAVLTPLATIN